MGLVPAQHTEHAPKRRSFRSGSAGRVSPVPRARRDRRPVRRRPRTPENPKPARAPFRREKRISNPLSPSPSVTNGRPPSLLRRPTPRGMLHWITMASCPVPAVHLLMIVLLSVIFIHVPAAAAVIVPNTNCYTFDNESRLVDFTHLVGKGFEYNEKGLQSSDLFVEFCKDVQKRSQGGFIKFGRFVSSHSFLSGIEHADYIQKFHYGDLVHCETTFEEMGRTAQVNIICGHCSNKACKDEHGCICSISYDELMCRVVIELAIRCVKSGPRVFKGFTVGFHPHSSEIVYNGLTQLGYEKLHHGFSFQTEQIHVSLYLSAMSSLSGLVGKPTFKVNPVKGLGVMLTGSAVNSAMPTTLSPTILNVDWRCEIARSSPYEVNILIPIEGYNPIEFTLSKECGI